MSFIDNNTALVLSGGGARAAYQVGVLTAVKDLLPPQSNPFPILAGTSAGAINAVSLASNSHDFQLAVEELSSLWQKLDIEHVFRTEWRDLLSGLTRIVRSFFHEGVDYHRPLSLLDNSPLNAFLKQYVNFANIDKNIERGILTGVSVSALAYNSGNTVSFFQGSPKLNEWKRARSVGTKTNIGMEHLLASSAIPWVFPTTRIGHEYFGDGAMRQISPVDPALYMGADKIFVIGVSNNRGVSAQWRRSEPKHPPSMAQIAGHMLSSVFIDSMESNLEHMEEINYLISLIPEKVKAAEDVRFRKVKSLIISPSKPIDKIAGRHVRYFPKSLRFFLRSSGATAKRGGSAISSYVLFVNSFTRELIDLGYQDAMWEQDKIKAFFDE